MAVTLTPEQQCSIFPVPEEYIYGSPDDGYRFDTNNVFDIVVNGTVEQVLALVDTYPSHVRLLHIRGVLAYFTYEFPLDKFQALLSRFPQLVCDRVAEECLWAQREDLLQVLLDRDWLPSREFVMRVLHDFDNAPDIAILNRVNHTDRLAFIDQWLATYRLDKLE